MDIPMNAVYGGLKSFAVILVMPFPIFLGLVMLGALLLALGSRPSCARCVQGASSTSI